MATEELTLPGFTSQLMLCVYEMQQQGTFCDARILTADREILAHRIVLFAGSQYFRTIERQSKWQVSSSEYNYDLRCEQTGDVQNIICLLYTGKLKVSQENVQRLTKLGLLLQMPSVVDACTVFGKKFQNENSRSDFLDQHLHESCIPHPDNACKNTELNHAAGSFSTMNAALSCHSGEQNTHYTDQHQQSMYISAGAQLIGSNLNIDTCSLTNIASSSIGPENNSRFHMIPQSQVNMSFTQLSSMGHERADSHKQLVMFHCDICLVMFTEETNLLTHRKNVHGLFENSAGHSVPDTLNTYDVLKSPNKCQSQTTVNCVQSDHSKTTIKPSVESVDPDVSSDTGFTNTTPTDGDLSDISKVDVIKEKANNGSELTTPLNIETKKSVTVSPSCKKLIEDGRKCHNKVKKSLALSNVIKEKLNKYKKIKSRANNGENFKTKLKSAGYERKCKKSMSARSNKSKDGDTKPFVCRRCKKYFDTKQERAAHIKSSHIGGTVVCEICKFPFKNVDWKYMMEHRYKKHNELLEPDKLKCPVYICEEQGCGYRTLFKARFNYHMNLVHKNERLFTCSECHKSFKSQKNLTVHLKTHLDSCAREVFQCELCGKKFKANSSLKRHIEKIHEKIDETKQLCHLCTYQSTNHRSMHNHLLKAHSIQPPKHVKVYQCSKCDFITLTRTHLTEHEGGHAGLSNQFICQLCGKIFQTERRLNNHYKIHTAEEQACPYDECNFHCKDKKNLRRHIQRQHDSSNYKPYGCPHCNYYCKEKGNLNKHITGKHKMEVVTLYKLRQKAMETGKGYPNISCN